MPALTHGDFEQINEQIGAGFTAWGLEERLFFRGREWADHGESRQKAFIGNDIDQIPIHREVVDREIFMQQSAQTGAVEIETADLLQVVLEPCPVGAYLTETRWSRCAALKADAQTDALAYKWHWNPSVMMASPPGAGSFRAGIEYSHGGVSLQEMVTPVLRIAASHAPEGSARLQEAKWTGAKCRVLVKGPSAGLRVDIRTSLSDPNTSLLADLQARETTTDGKVTVFLEDDADMGRDAEIVLLDASGQVIHSLPTTLGQ